MQQSRDGRWQARARVRDRDGRVREVSATADSKGAARRALVRRLEVRRDPVTAGVTADMTVETLASFWLAHRQTHGRAGQAGRLRPSTMGAYDAVLRTVVVPALGGFRVGELSVGVLEAAFADIEAGGRSTVQARSVLNQMLGLAARHGAIQASPMLLVEKPARAPREVQALDVDEARRLRRVVDPDHRRAPGHRGPNHDLADLVDVLLGTGMRIGEALALRWQDLDLSGDPPTVHVSGTLLEPRRGHVATLTRQDGTKTGQDRTLILPAAVVEGLAARRRLTMWRRPDDPVFASRTGTWLWPNNIRTRLRQAVSGISDLHGTTPHTLRRTVGTLVAHEAGLDATREQLGHSDPSVTYQRYVAARRVAPDLRSLLDRFFVTEGASGPEDDPPLHGSSGGFTGVSTESRQIGVETTKPPTLRSRRSEAFFVEPPVGIEPTT
ncbi:tyrosine-type recombinase/integrase [Nocardioides sediminis]|uniref:tyrosine-type recombinase/integrase n=1 Tax=Nocardioides sediminis TaxID=433648 RepID=UPI00131EF3B8|nr:site-specific integrase [Nocardioides sediminis]